MRNCIFALHTYDAHMSNRENEWIATRLKEVGKRGKDLASALGIEPPRVTEIIKGNRKVATDELAPMARILDLAIEDVQRLLSKKGAKVTTKLTVAGRKDNNTVIVRGSVEAGSWKEAIYWPEDDWKTVPVYDERFDVDELEGFEVNGDSMNLVYPPGSVVICRWFDPVNELPPVGHRVVIRRRDASGLVEATVKLLERDEHGQGWLTPQSTNPAHKKITFKPNGDGENDTEIVGIVIGSYRKE